MEGWIFDRKLLQVGLIKIDPREVATGLPTLNSQFRNWKRSDTHANRVLTYNRHFEHTLLYHRPFVETAFDYDVCNWLNFVGVTLEHYAELRHFMERMVFRNRKLWAKWNSNNIRYSFYAGYFRLLNEEDYLLPLEGNWYRVGGSGGSRSLDSTSQGLDLSAAFRKTWREIADPRIKPLIRHDFKEISLASSLDLLDFLITELTEKCCPPSHYQLTIDLLDLKDSPHAPVIWHIWENNWFAPKGFDRYALPKDSTVVRAYPIINVMSTNESYGLDYALNVVHVRGESFVEVQAYECPEMLQMTADVFGVPVDVWEGPLEDRFGWYGDVSKGTTYRLEPKTSKTFVSQLESVFVAAPKRLWLCRDGKERDAPEIYQRPHAIASSLDALQNAADAKGLDLYGDKDPGLLLGGAFGEFSAEQFDWFQYPTEVQDKTRKLAGIKPGENFVQQMENKWEQLPRTVQIEMVKLLNLTQYRITELSLSKEDRAKLEKALTSKRVTRATDHWIASLLNQTGEWEILDDDYEPSYDSEDGAAFY